MKWYGFIGLLMLLVFLFTPFILLYGAIKVIIMTGAVIFVIAWIIFAIVLIGKSVEN